MSWCWGGQPTLLASAVAREALHWSLHHGSPWLSSTDLVYLGRGNKPSGFLPAVTAKLLRVLSSEDNGDEWEQSGGCRSSWHSLDSLLHLFAASCVIALYALHVPRECGACLGTGRPLSLSDSILSCSFWATVCPIAFLPAFSIAYSSTHSCSSPSQLYFFYGFHSSINGIQVEETQMQRVCSACRSASSGLSVASTLSHSNHTMIAG